MEGKTNAKDDPLLHGRTRQEKHNEGLSISHIFTDFYKMVETYSSEYDMISVRYRTNKLSYSVLRCSSGKKQKHIV